MATQQDKLDGLVRKKGILGAKQEFIQRIKEDHQRIFQALENDLGEYQRQYDKEAAAFFDEDEPEKG